MAYFFNIKDDTLIHKKSFWYATRSQLVKQTIKSKYGEDSGHIKIYITDITGANTIAKFNANFFQSSSIGYGLPPRIECSTKKAK